MADDKAKDGVDLAPATAASEVTEEPAQEEVRKGRWGEAFRVAFERTRRQQKPKAGRQELGRDKSKAFVLLMGTGVALLLLFFGIFSSPRKHTPLPGQNPHGQASLGRKSTPGQQSSDPAKTVTPMLSADVGNPDPGLAGRVTPEDVGRTSRTGGTASAAMMKPPAASVNSLPDFALGRVDFSDPLAAQGRTVPSPPPTLPSELESGKDQSADLKKPSLVFVRSIEATPAIKPSLREDGEGTLALPAGTRLVARLQAPASSAVAAPVVSVVEYNYERDGQVVLPAGAKVFGRLAQVNPSGYMDIQFNRVEMPDGTSEKIEASAMDLSFGPLKGHVSGKRTGAKFLVHSLTGLGTVASYLVGPQASSSAGLISADTLLRERLADNVAAAGQEELNNLAFNQNLVVTLPGNTRFYIVVQKPTSDRGSAKSGNRTASMAAPGFEGGVPTLEELRQLIQLRREINELYVQGHSQSVPQPRPQQ